MMHRNPAVAGRFYPGDTKTLEKTVADMLSQAHIKKIEGVIGAVSPHAGYIYSGGVCAETLNSIDIPETVLILGPNHHGRGAQIALSDLDWKLPGGIVPINRDLLHYILNHADEAQVDESAHQFEHSLEVQVPFLQALQKDLSIVPLALSHIPYSACKKLATGLALAITQYNKPVLLLASSDMSHYESREAAEIKDKLALDKLISLDPEGLYQTVSANRISMCGVIPATVVLEASIQLGGNRAQIIRYTDSGAVSGDTDQVVGYAGAVISKA